MDSLKTTSRITGVLFITATVATVISQIILEPILNAPNMLLAFSINQIQSLFGIFFELVNAFASVGIAISVYSVLKKHSNNRAVAYVSFRTIEAVLGIVTSVFFLLLLTLSQESLKAGTINSIDTQILSHLLLSGHDKSFLLLLIVFSVGAVMFYFLLIQTRLVPRVISIWGLAGAILLITANMLELFGVFSKESIFITFFSLPIAINEMVLAAWLIIKGFHLEQVKTTGQ